MFCWSAFRATFSPEAFSIRDATWDFCSSNRAFSSSNKACTIRFTSFIKFFSTFLVSLGFVFLAQMDKSHRKCATFYSIALVTTYTASYSVRQSLKKGKLQKKKQKDPVAKVASPNHSARPPFQTWYTLRWSKLHFDSIYISDPTYSYISFTINDPF